jgi:hypothetical protein
MKMKDILSRFNDLESRGLGLTVAERNEMRDCEIALGMTTHEYPARVEAIRRCEKHSDARLSPAPEHPVGKHTALAPRADCQTCRATVLRKEK